MDMDSKKMIHINPDHVESVEFLRWAACGGMPEEFKVVYYLTTGRSISIDLKDEASFLAAEGNFIEKWGRKFDIVLMQ